MAKKDETVETTEENTVKGRPSKLNDEQVIDIRTRYHTVKKEELAAEFGISTAYLYKVATGMAAKNVDFALVPKPEKVEEPVETEADSIPSIEDEQ